MTPRWSASRLQRRTRTALRFAALLASVLVLISAASLSLRAARIVFPEPATVEPGRCAPGGITTIAGNGRANDSGDGGPAIRAGLDDPCDMAVAADGSIYIADTDNNRIRKVDPNGVITTVAGDGWRDEKRNLKGRFQGDGSPAAEASLCQPHGVALGPDGSIYIADTDNNRIRKVEPSGIMTTVAGTGREGDRGDGGLATKARLNWPRSVAVGSDGSLYIADTCNHRVRKVDPNGIITTIAGNGEEGYWGDDGPAAECILYFPRGVAVGADGTVYIADYGNNRIRKVGTNGIITTVAGDGRIDWSGDGGPAGEASLYHPRGVALGPDGSVYIADTWNHRIRKVHAVNGRVGPKGLITTVAGSGREAYGGDGRRATSAHLRSPEDVEVAPDGSIYIADRLNNRIRKVCAGEPVPIPPIISLPR